MSSIYYKLPTMESFCYTRKHFCISTPKLKTLLEYSRQQIFGNVVSEVDETLTCRLSCKIPMTLNKLVPDIFMPRSSTSHCLKILRIQSKCGKIWTRKTPNTDTFHAVSRNVMEAFWLAASLYIENKMKMNPTLHNNVHP